MGREEAYFVKGHSDSKNKYTEDDIIKMLEFLVDNFFVGFAGKIFQQIFGIIPKYLTQYLINIPEFENYLGQMYPVELEIKDTTEAKPQDLP